MGHTAGLTGGFGGAASFFGGASTSGAAFLAGATFLGGGADGAACRGAGGPPALHLTVAVSKASFIFAFRKSGNASIVAFSGRSPTIFMSVPKQTAASLRAPSNPSSSKTANDSARGLICAGGMGDVAEDKLRPRNFNVPSFT